MAMLFRFPNPQKQVLVIDDDGSLQRLVRIHLQNHTDYEVLQALDGRSGLLRAKVDHPCLIILDWMLPDIEGVEILSALKSYSGTQDIPVLMMTGRNKICDIEGAFNRGADDYLTKPFALNILKKKMQNILGSV